MSEGIERYKIQNLNISVKNAFVIGILINKSDVKIFESKQNGLKRGVLTLTIRDSKRFFINCIVWGSDTFIESYNLDFHLGMIVNVIQPKIQLKSGDKSEIYNPLTTSPYLLSINEGKGYITKYTGEDIHEYCALMKQPMKSTCSIYTLADVNANVNSLKNDYVDLLVIVRNIKPIRTIQIKSVGGAGSTIGMDRKFREIILMDRSFSGGMCLKLWNMEIIEKSNGWIPMTTVLHIIDVRPAFSHFYNGVILELTGRTMIQENPDTYECKRLLEWSIMSPVTNDMDVALYVLSANTTDIDGITKVMTVQQILNRSNNGLHSLDDDQFTAIVYALITKFDLDGIQSKLYSRRCVRCKQSMPTNTEQCTNEDCVLLQMGSSSANDKSAMMFNINNDERCYIDMFDIKMNLTDHTGTLINCRLVNRFAEQILAHSFVQFQQMDNTERCALKWKYLLERCTVKLICKPKSANRAKLFVTIVDCYVSDPQEVADKIKIY